MSPFDRIWEEEVLKPNRERIKTMMRHLIDETWKHCTESETVPSTETADMLIEKTIRKFG